MPQNEQNNSSPEPGGSASSPSKGDARSRASREATRAAVMAHVERMKELGNPHLKVAEMHREDGDDK